MTKEIKQSRQFKRDLKLAARQQKPLNKLYNIVEKLANDQPLEYKHKPHILSGNWANYWECHIMPDWLLIYKVDDNYVTLYRTGTHAMLFKK